MANAAARTTLTHAEFLLREAASDVRHALHDGEVFAMAGGTRIHALTATSLATELTRALEAAGRDCGVYGSDVRISPREGQSMYADVTVACPPVAAPAYDRDAIANPVLVAEALSPSTADWDMGGKFALYREFRSLRHYLLVHTDAWHVLHYARQPDGAWRLTEHGPDDTIELSALGLTLPVRSIYARVAAQGGPSPEALPMRAPRRADAD